jgi:hypothetical protein
MPEVVVKEHPLSDLANLADLAEGAGSVRVAASGRQRVNAKNAPSHANGPLGGTPPIQRGTDHDETTTPRRRQQRPSRVRCDRPYTSTRRRREGGRHTACSRTNAVLSITAVAVVVALRLHVAMRGASLHGAALCKLASSCHKTNVTLTAAAEPFGGEKQLNTQKRSPRGEEGSIDGTYALCECEREDRQPCMVAAAYV